VGESGDFERLQAQRERLLAREQLAAAATRALDAFDAHDRRTLEEMLRVMKQILDAQIKAAERDADRAAAAERTEAKMLIVTVVGVVVAIVAVIVSVVVS
jgi:hypothetical protein